jgi:3'(2'), 5'-bisphosphate nucleotidase
VISLPAKKTTYYATDKAFCNGKLIHANNEAKIENMIMCMSRSHATEKEEELRTHFKDVIISGSSLKGCRVAEGTAHAYFRLGGQSEWDVCAMHAIINAAGGRMTLLDGKEIVYNKPEPKTGPFLASNGKAHGDLLKLV